MGVVPRPIAAMAGWAGSMVESISGREQDITRVTVKWAYEPGFVVSSARAVAELGYAPGRVDTGIEAAWEWFRREQRT